MHIECSRSVNWADAVAVAVASAHAEAVPAGCQRRGVGLRRVVFDVDA
jgi:hypothetical protein